MVVDTPNVVRAVVDELGVTIVVVKVGTLVGDAVGSYVATALLLPGVVVVNVVVRISCFVVEVGVDHVLFEETLVPATKVGVLVAISVGETVGAWVKIVGLKVGAPVVGSEVGNALGLAVGINVMPTVVGALLGPAIG